MVVTAIGSHVLLKISMQKKFDLYVICIHVNPPSFVRSLRHFDIAENLRPGDENLRHLTVTSRFKKTVYFWQAKVKTQPNFRAFSTFYSSAGAQRSKVDEIIIWLAIMRDYIQRRLYILLCACSFHDHANMKA